MDNNTQFSNQEFHHSKFLSLGEESHSHIVSEKNRWAVPQIPYGSLQYFAIVGIGGAISTAVNRIMTTPLDNVKCRMQVNPAKYDKFFKGMRLTYKEERFRGLFAGWAPMAIGQGLRASANFGVYEFCKFKISGAVGEESAHRYRPLIFSVSAVIGEIVGGVALSPFECAKIRSQTDPSAPRQMRKCMPMIYREGGIQANFKGLTPLLLRIVPSAIPKFVAYEYTSEISYNHILKKKRSECTKSEQMYVALVSSCAAGVSTAIASNPPDVWTSLMCRHRKMGLWEAVRVTGFRHMFSGLSSRMVVLTFMNMMQFNMIEYLKIRYNLGQPK